MPYSHRVFYRWPDNPLSVTLRTGTTPTTEADLQADYSANGSKLLDQPFNSANLTARKGQTRDGRALQSELPLLADQALGYAKLIKDSTQ